MALETARAKAHAELDRKFDAQMARIEGEPFCVERDLNELPQH